MCIISYNLKQGKSEGFNSCDRPKNLTQIGPKSSIFSPCDLPIWWMTSKNNGAPLLYYVRLCASFQIHWWIQTGVTVWKRSIRVKIGDFLFHVTLKFDGRPWETIRHLFYTPSSFMHHFKAMSEFKLTLESSVTLTIDLWPLTLTFCVDITFVIGNNSWKFHDDTMMGTYWKRCDGQTDRQTDRQKDGRTEPFIELLGRS